MMQFGGAMPVGFEALKRGDVYIGYAFEDAKFRCDKQSDKAYCPFYGEAEEEAVSWIGERARLSRAVSSAARRVAGGPRLPADLALGDRSPGAPLRVSGTGEALASGGARV